ncbi:hypothetical protein Zm00014a_037552 [Zea mays]|uniref:Uncharacterized protein n=1 Tax=Zea mays TaxID=4577 RepID=A0A3L6FLU9_MAIZE|nr:hypothetical protein Zm00014a_037552 [Zea mays]
MGRGKKSSFFASLFGCKKQSSGGRQQEVEAAASTPPQRYYQYQGTRVRPSDDDDYYYGKNWYADRDINRRASEYIERMHRVMQASKEDE